MKITEDNNLWIDARLNQEEMDFLHQAMLVTKQDKENNRNWNPQLAGNISKSELIEDKDNWFYEKVLKELTEKMFLSTDNNYYRYHVEKKEPLPEFEMVRFWVNYMKQHEFNPLHNHNEGRGYSFVIFVKIPIYWKDQHALSFSANSNSPSASDFSFIWSEKNSNICTNATFTLNPEDEGRILFFPAWLQHMVYPFYECEEERVTISGNIAVYDRGRGEETIPIPEDEYGRKEYLLKTMENSVEFMKNELKDMKKGGENRGSN